MFILCMLSMLGASVCAFLNPYVNLFGTFPAIACITMLICYSIGIQHLKESKKQNNDAYIHTKTGRACLITFVIVCVITCILSTIISITLTLFGNNPTFDILNIENDPGLCKCVLFMQFFCHFMTVITANIQREYIIIKLLSLNPANLQSKERISNL